ncbi:LIM/homeobox protein Lhx9-like isoform X1 [Diachasmimorpha longicaudata]|uniref:LIM/homeobox protein Lhx9-like isoform X1 n=1 Tax=Diachasmimorpha longicaudata TaxID=58733 RepID=UPI0030B8B3AA
MNPHHPGHTAAYPHHPSLSSSPHHTGPGGPHHSGYATGNSSSGGGSGGGSGSTSTPDLPSPHSPPSHSGQTDPGTPYGSIGGTPGMGSNGHHHGGGAMMGDNPHHPVHTHPHLPGHPAYPPVNHNNNCTLKQEAGQQGTPIQTCSGCGGRIVERFFLHAIDRYWHNSCLKCAFCNHPLAEMGASCFIKNGQVLCKPDYTRMYGSTAQCAGCSQTIPADQLVTRAAGVVFHPKCFVCSKCGEPLLSGAKYTLMSGQPVCEPDWHKLMKSSSVASAGGVQTITGNGGAPQRKNKVGRPRRSRE